VGGLTLFPGSNVVNQMPVVVPIGRGVLKQGNKTCKSLAKTVFSSLSSPPVCFDETVWAKNNMVKI
jgi:hypothetical protein